MSRSKFWRSAFLGLALLLTFPTWALTGKDDPSVVHMLLTLGQSNASAASNVEQSVTPREPTKNFMLENGPRVIHSYLLTVPQPPSCIPYGSPALACTDMNPANHTAIVPLVEGQEPDRTNNCCETASSAMLAKLTSMGVTNELFALNCGRGGMSLQKLDKAANGGEGYYEHCLVMAQRVVDLYALQNKTVVITAVHWSQGTSDMDTPYQDYYDRFDAYVHNVQTDFKAITGQSDPIPFMILQDGSDGGLGLIDMPLPFGEAPEVQAQFDFAIAYPSLARITSQQYPWEHATDGLHLTGNSQLGVGESHALAYFDWIWNGNTNWSPFRPTNFVVTSNLAYVYYKGNGGTPVFDAAHVLLLPLNNGFQIFRNCDPNNQVPILNSQIEPTLNRIKITASLNLNQMREGLCIGYAWNNGVLPTSIPGPLTGRRGTLRDSVGTLRLFDGGGLLGLPLLGTINQDTNYKWFTRFKLPITWSAP